MQTKASIYVLIDPRDGEIRYVGWTSYSLNDRLAAHMVDHRSTCHRVRWVSLLKRLSLRPIIRRVQFVPISQVHVAERYWIAFHRSIGCRLTNSTDGGEGTLGLQVSDETRLRLSNAAKGNKSHTGRTFSLEHRTNISKGHKGKKRTAATRTAISAALKGHAVSQDVRNAVGQANKERIWTDAMRRQSSQRFKGAAHPLYGKVRSQETRDKIGATKRARWIGVWFAYRLAGFDG